MKQKQEWMWEKIVLASHNQHKLREFQSLFEREFALEVTGLDETDNIPEIVEDGETFEANALKKAKTVGEILKVPTIADDSGLAVEALGGAPGIYSARYAGEHGNDVANNQKLLQEMEHIPLGERRAQFVCVLVLFLPDAEAIIVRGECPGHITFHPRGTNGFGYDPIFELEGRGVTMAELSPEEKDQVSHRARAMQALAHNVRQRFSFN